MELINREKLKLNPTDKMDISVEYYEDHPILIIDNFYQNPEFVRELALSLDFFLVRGHYPGFFSIIGLQQKEVADLVNDLLGKALKTTVAFHDYCKEMAFAMVSTPPDELNVVQKQPHHDNFCDMAGLVYLNKPEYASGGTSFWKHKETGIQVLPTIDSTDDWEDIEDRLGLKGEHALLEYIFKDGKKNPIDGYPLGSSKYWELKKVLEMKWNRFVFYDSRILHSIYYDPANFPDEKANRRLSQNFFFVRN